MNKDLTAEDSGIYEFDGFRLDTSKRLLLGAEGTPLPLMPKAYDLLVYLAANSERLVDKDELMSAVWPDTIVEENNLTQNVSSIRKILGERHRENRFIATIPGRGYRFVAQVHRVSARPVDQAGMPSDTKALAVRNRKTWVAMTILVALTLALAMAGVIFWAAPSTRRPMIRSMAVLPFKPIAVDKRDESLEMGMADTLILKLSAIENLKVLPLASVRRFSSPEQDLVRAGRELGVDAVLEGRLQSSGNRIRANVQLFDVRDGAQLWAGQFDQDFENIFDLQDSIAQRVAGQLSASLGQRGTKRYTDNIEAYQLYMLGNLHARRLVKTEVEKGLEYYDKAIRVDPGFALAYVEISNANRALVLTSDAPARDLMPASRDAALKAVEIDSELPEAWAAVANAEFWYDWNWQAADEHFRRAMALDPNSASTLAMHAHFLSNRGLHEEAIDEIRRAREMDPASLIINAIEGQVLFFAGDKEAAEDSLKRTVDLDPRFWLGHLFLTRVQIASQRWENAISSSRMAAELSDGNAEAMATMAYCLARAGRPAAARTVLADLKERSKHRYVPRYDLAQIHLALGEQDEAIENLRAAVEARDALMTFLKVEPKWDPLRDDPRFKELLLRMNF